MIEQTEKYSITRFQLDEQVNDKDVWDEIMTHPIPAALHISQCETCKFSEMRTCIYHGYPKDIIPVSCRYKIGVDAEEAQCNICTKLRAERENVLNDVLNKIRSLELSSWNEEYLLRNIDVLRNKPEGA